MCIRDSLYGALSTGEHVEDVALPELAVQYVDYALWQRSALGDVLDVYRDYWREHLHDGALGVLEMPLDLPRPAAQTFNGDAISVVIAPDVTRRLEHLARSHGATLFQLALALWAVALCRHAGQEEVVVGSPSVSYTHLTLPTIYSV